MLVKEIESMNFKDGQFPRQAPPPPPPKSSKQPSSSSSTSTFKSPSVTTPPLTNTTNFDTSPFKHTNTSNTNRDSIDLPMSSNHHQSPSTQQQMSIYDNINNIKVPPKPAERKLLPEKSQPGLLVSPSNSSSYSSSSSQSKSSENLNKKTEPNDSPAKNGTGGNNNGTKVEGNDDSVKYDKIKRNIKRAPKMSDNEARRILGN